MSTVLATGGGGYIGSILVETLLDAGAYRVVWASHYMSRVAEDRLLRACRSSPGSAVHRFG